MGVSSKEKNTHPLEWHLNTHIIFQSDYLIVLARTYLNPEIKGLCP